MLVRREDEGASAGGCGLRQPVEGVATKERPRSSLLPASLSLWLLLRERPESGGTGNCGLFANADAPAPLSVSSSSGSTASGKAPTKVETTRGWGRLQDDEC